MRASPIFDRVADLVSRLSPHPICDGCIAGKLNLAHAQLVNPATRQLASRTGFERRRDICATCYGERLVIRRP